MVVICYRIISHEALQFIFLYGIRGLKFLVVQRLMELNLE
jgi:hypothetical protein